MSNDKVIMQWQVNIVMRWYDVAMWSDIMIAWYYDKIKYDNVKWSKICVIRCDEI